MDILKYGVEIMIPVQSNIGFFLKSKILDYKKWLENCIWVCLQKTNSQNLLIKVKRNSYPSSCQYDNAEERCFCYKTFNHGFNEGCQMYIRSTTDAMWLTNWPFYMILYGMAYRLVWTTDQFSALLITELSLNSSHLEMLVFFFFSFRS